MLQKLAEQLEVPFQLTHVHRGVVGLLGRIWGRGQADLPQALWVFWWLTEGSRHTHDPPI